MHSLCPHPPSASLQTGEKLSQAKIHSGPLTDMQLFKDKTFMVTSSKDSTAKLLDAQTLKEVKVYKSDRPLNSAAISPLFDQVGKRRCDEVSHFWCLLAISRPWLLTILGVSSFMASSSCHLIVGVSSSVMPASCHIPVI